MGQSRMKGNSLRREGSAIDPGGRARRGFSSGGARLVSLLGYPRKRGRGLAPGAGRVMEQSRGEDGGWWARRCPALTPAPALQCHGSVPPGVCPGLRERLVCGTRPLPLPLWLCRPQLLHRVSLQPPQRVCRCGGPRPLPALPQSHQGGLPGPPPLLAFSRAPISHARGWWHDPFQEM